MDEPEDVEGECNAHLYIGDNYGDNRATIRCGFPEGHNGEHREVFHRRDRNGEIRQCIVTWEHDERCRHDWMSLRSQEGKAAFFGDDPEEPWLFEEYEGCLKNGKLYVCRFCQKTVPEPTTKAFP